MRANSAFEIQFRMSYRLIAKLHSDVRSRQFPKGRSSMLAADYSLPHCRVSDLLPRPGCEQAKLSEGLGRVKVITHCYWFHIPSEMTSPYRKIIS